MAHLLSQSLSEIDLYSQWFGLGSSAAALFKYYNYLMSGADMHGYVFVVSDLNCIAVLSRHKERSNSIWLATCYMIKLVHPRRWLAIISIIKNIYELNRCRPDKGYYYLDAIATVHKYRGAGLASALLYGIYDAIKCEGGGMLICDTSTDALIHLLEKHGWAKIAETKLGKSKYISTFLLQIYPRS